MRFLPVCLLAAVMGALFSPFLITAWLRDHRGIEISGKVTKKQETVWHSRDGNDITRKTSVTVSYNPPGQGWAVYQTVNVPLERYDAIHRGDILRMRYLLERDLPDYPLLHSLYRSGFLPLSSVDGRSVFTIWRDLLAELPLRILFLFAGGALGLWLLFRLRVPGRMLIAAICLIAALAAINYSELPKPMPHLQGDVLTAAGKVQNDWTLTHVFDGRRSSIGWNLDQPVQYVAIEFVPEGRTEPVVALDRIDAKSIPLLTAGRPVTVQYEQASPRNARLTAGTRTFWGKNLRGLAFAGVFCVVAGGAVLALWALVSRRSS